MILSRITKAIREQNWFAVAIEFVIVVLGVVIGFQISEWRSEVSDRATESTLIARLHDEARALAAARDDTRRVRERIAGLLIDAIYILDDAEAGALPDEACAAIAYSHIYTRPPDELPVVEDLIATGRMDLLQSAELRRAVTQFIRERDEGRNVVAEIEGDRNRLAIQYPDLIQWELQPRGDPLRLSRRARCDTGAMRNSTRFMNALIDNSGRNTGFVQSALFEPDIALANVIALTGTDSRPDTEPESETPP